MMYRIETKRSKELGYHYEILTGSGMTIVNVCKNGKDVDCFTINKNITDVSEVLAHIEEWEAYSEEAYNE